MKRQLSRFSMYSIVVCLSYTALTPIVAAHQPDAGNEMGFGEAFDWQQDNRRYARSLAQLDVGEPFTVRLIYFLPSDRQPKPDIDAKFHTSIRDVQQFYADVMEHHGFGRKTFRFETDSTGKAVVHHVNGKSDDEYYRKWPTRAWDEIDEQFDTSRNIVLVALEISEYFDDNSLGKGGGGSTYGKVVVPSFLRTGRASNNFSVDNTTVIHELGHAFGLLHDFRDDINLAPVSQNYSDAMASSFCAAEWYDVHRYFNMNQFPFNDYTSVQMMRPSLAVPPLGIRLRFAVTDDDGLHQAQLMVFDGVFSGNAGVIGCKSLEGTSTTVEFINTRLLGVTSVALRVMDKHGNFTSRSFPIDIIPLLPPSESISIPDPNLASAIRESNKVTV